MPINKLGAPGVPLQAPFLPIALISGTVFNLPAGQGTLGTFGAAAAPQIASNNVLSGQYIVNLGANTNLEVFDPGQGFWRNIQSNSGGQVVSSDGTNFRLSNTLSCPTGGTITNAGAGYANGFYGYNQAGALVSIVNGTTTVGNTNIVITPSAGGSLWSAIIGGSINSTIGLTGTLFQNQAFGGTGVSVVGSGGSAYTRAPAILFSPPPNQGSQPYILPTATCTIAAGAINAVTVVSAGAGLLGLPGITVVPVVGDITGGGAQLGWTVGNSGQVGSGTLTAIWPSFYGTGLAVAPTLAFAPASTTAVTVTGNTFAAIGTGTAYLISL